MGTSRREKDSLKTAWTDFSKRLMISLQHWKFVSKSENVQKSFDVRPASFEESCLSNYCITIQSTENYMCLFISTKEAVNKGCFFSLLVLVMMTVIFVLLYVFLMHKPDINIKSIVAQQVY